MALINQVTASVPTTTLGLFAFVGALVIYLAYRVINVGRRPAHLPPGPPTEPIWGNLKQIDPKFPKHQLTRWASIYGPVYTIMQGSTPQVVVSGAKEARDVFVRQGAHTQDRPPSRFLLLMRDGYFPSGMSGPKWKTARRMWQAVLNPSAARKYVPYQELETEQLLYDILDDPTDWVDHLERFTNSIGMLMVNGYRVASSKDPVVKETLEDIYEVSRMRVRGLPLDIWPFLWKLPIRLLPIYKVALQSANQHRDFIWKHYLTVKQKIARGVGIPSFSQAIQEKLNTGWNDVSEIEGAEISHHLLSGATDTIVSTLLACIAALCLHPEVQHRAQEEIEQVVGSNRLPTDADVERLPYVQQVILEAQRWIPAVPLAVPRAANGFVKLGDYNIPKGTEMILNTYAIHLDPATYPEPHRFRPERWSGDFEEARANGRKMLFTFGAGRRICPAKSVAENIFFLAMTRWLWAFDTAHARDERGNKIPINIAALRPGIVNRLEPFSIDIKPKSHQKADLIRRTWKETCSSLLDENMQWRTTPEQIEALFNREKDRAR